MQTQQYTLPAGHPAARYPTMVMAAGPHPFYQMFTTGPSNVNAAAAAAAAASSALFPAYKIDTDPMNAMPAFNMISPALNPVRQPQQQQQGAQPAGPQMTIEERSAVSVLEDLHMAHQAQAGAAAVTTGSRNLSPAGVFADGSPRVAAAGQYHRAQGTLPTSEQLLRKREEELIAQGAIPIRSISGKSSCKSPVKCRICDKEITRKSNFASHMRVHSGERPFVCSHSGCGKAFAQRCNLRRHELLHSGEKPFSCSHCNFKCNRSELLKIHRRTDCKGLPSQQQSPAHSVHQQQQHHQNPLQPQVASPHNDQNTISSGSH